MEALAEFEMLAVATAQHVLWYRLRLAQKWRRWILECHLVHLRQPHGELPVVCEHIITNYTVIQTRGCVAVMWVEQSISFTVYYRQNTIFFPGFTNEYIFSCNVFHVLKIQVNWVKLNPEDEVTTITQNINNYVPFNMAYHHKELNLQQHCYKKFQFLNVFMAVWYWLCFTMVIQCKPRIRYYQYTAKICYWFQDLDLK